MGQGNQQRPNPNPNKAAEKNNNHHIHKVHVGLMDVFFGLLTTIFISVGGVLASDTQLRWPGVFFILGGIVAGACGIFIHTRHRLFKKRTPDVPTLLSFCAAFVFLITLGSSQWWFLTTKDRDSFNVIAGARIISPLPVEGGMTAFSSIASLGSDTVLHPITLLIYLQVTNKKSSPSSLVGISIDSASNKSWWPSWVKLCPVDLRSDQLMFASNLKNATLFSGDNSLERKVFNRPLSSMETVSGWTAWECQRGYECDAKNIRIGLADAAGTVSWQVVDDIPVTPNLQESTMRPVGAVDLQSSPIRMMSSCRSSR